MGEAIIGVDIGSSRIKAVAYDASGAPLSEAAVATPVRIGGDVQDFPVLDMLLAARQVVTQAAAGHSIRGVGIAAMGEVGTLMRDGALAAVDFPSWHDARGSELVRRLRPLADRLRAHRRTGGHFRTVSTVAKLGWLAQRQDVAGGTFLNVASAFAWTLTGECTQDASLATTTGVIDPVDGTAITELWAAAGLDEVGLAPVDPPATAHPAATEIARQAGLAGVTPIVVAGHDHPVAAVGTGATADAVVDSLGTGEPLIAQFASPRHLPRLEVEHFPPPGFAVEASPSTGAPIVIAEGLRPGLAMQALVTASRLSRAELDERIDPDATDALDPEDVLALERGEPRIPADPRGRSTLHAHVVARAAEADRAVRRLAGATGPTVLTGGGLRSTSWVAMKARAAAHPMVVSTAQETAARGAAAIAGVAAQWWETAEAMPGAELLAVDEWLTQAPERR